jgi:TonB family protein
MLRIDTEGKVKDARVMGGDSALTQAAIDSVRQWRFKPPIQNGSSVESDYVADVVFKLH